MSELWYAVDAGYDGKQKKALLRFYNPKTAKIITIPDKTGHTPYLLTDAVPEELRGLKGVIKTELIKKYSALEDKDVFLTKVYAEDPLMIGGDNASALRNVIPERVSKRVWEKNIKYDLCYIYDRDVKVGMPHELNGGEMVPYYDEEAEAKVVKLLELFTSEDKEMLESMEKWARLLEYPVPYFKRIALDIEVYNEKKKIADPNIADMPILCACLMDDKGRKIALVLKIPDKPLPKGIEDAEIRFFIDEAEMLLYLFKILNDYPFVITFNGDGFDLHYIYQRAKNLGIPPSDIPIFRKKKIFSLKNALHIDLYKFFFIKAIQIYAFKAKYKNDDLDSVGRGLINLGKLKLSKERNKEIEEKGFVMLTYEELINYCLRDVEITLKLTSFDESCVMNLILALSRISRMPMEVASRHAVGRWIRSFMYYEHRQRNYLIPNTEEILELKGQTLTKAIIKGKKYKGAIVVEPIAGVHFNVSVMDFASLYPSIIKEYNLGYQTVRCDHLECQDNIVPNTPHWVCRKHRAIESIFIGSMRDLRVEWYKQEAKRKDLPKELKAWYSVIEQAIKVICNACFTPDTFSLTKNGIKNIKDFKIGDHIYSWNKNTGLIEDDEVIETQEFDYNDDLIILKNVNMDLKVTKNHRFRIFDRYKKKQCDIIADNINSGKIIPQHSWVSRRKRRKLPKLIDISGWVSIPCKKTKKTLKDSYKTSYKIPRVFKSKDFLKLLSWYVTEGSITNYPEYNSHRISISQTKHNKEIKNLLIRMRLQFKETKKGFILHSNILANLFENLCGIYSENKRMPSWILDLNREYLEVVWKTMMKGDGDKRGYRYTSKSYKLAEFFLILTLLLGKNPRLEIEKNIYRVYWRNPSSGIYLKSYQIGKEKYNGKVYCITTKKNHYIFAGRNGRFTLTGQSYGVFGSDAFDLYCPPVSEEITAIGRYAIGQSIEMAENSGIKVLYGDTDSIFMKKPTEEQIEKLVKWASENLRMDLEVDKEYRFCVLSKRKKNYIGVKTDGELDIKGLTGKKKHIPKLINDAFNEAKNLLKEIQKESDFPTAKQGIRKVVRNTYLKIKRREWNNLEELAFHMILGKEIDKYIKTTPQHVRAARMLQEAGYEIGGGEPVSYVKVVPKGKDKKTTACPTLLAKNEDIDIKKYITFLKSTFKQFLDGMDMDFEEILGLTRLEKWCQ